MFLDRRIGSQVPETIILPARAYPGIPWQELKQFSGLILSLVRRDVVTRYRRTLLGPIWYLIHPLLMSNLFAIIFIKIGKIQIGDAPPYLFYLSVLPVWNYFTRALESSASSLISNGRLFSKVYFPRLIIPLANTLSPLFIFGIQFTLFLLLLSGERLAGHVFGEVTMWLYFIPAMVGLTFVLSLGLGLWFSALTVRYRDGNHALGFLTQIAFYVTPVLYPSSLLKGKWAVIMKLNPMFAVVEGFRKAFFGIGQFDIYLFAQAWAIALVVAISGVLYFNHVQQDFVDVL